VARAFFTALVSLVFGLTTLGANSSIVISYLKSCRREKIDGIGTVIVGTDESVVHLSSVTDEKTACDATYVHATTRETSQVAATVLRSIPKNDTLRSCKSEGAASCSSNDSIYQANDCRSISTASRPREHFMILPSVTNR
jgi:hypothetical protein